MAACEESARLGYAPTEFEAMIKMNGGVRTAQKLVLSSEIQSGLKKLKKLGRLDLSMEAIMLLPEFAPLFSEGELAAARWRLDSL